MLELSLAFLRKLGLQLQELLLQEAQEQPRALALKLLLALVRPLRLPEVQELQPRQVQGQPPASAQG